MLWYRMDNVKKDDIKEVNVLKNVEYYLLFYNIIYLRNLFKFFV